MTTSRQLAAIIFIDIQGYTALMQQDEKIKTVIDRRYPKEQLAEAHRYVKAVVLHKYGSPDHLELIELEKPVPKDKEVLAQVHASGEKNGYSDGYTSKLLSLLTRLNTEKTYENGSLHV